MQAACFPGPHRAEGSAAPPGPDAAQPADSLIPAGFGSLRQDDVAVTLQLRGFQIRAIPLDQNVIRTLSPDSWRALHELVNSQRARIDEARKRFGLTDAQLWYVSFFGHELGETRFSPRELIISNVGRDFRPVEVIGLSPGFGSQRLRQREVQSAIYIFDGQLDVNQPLAVQYETTRTSDWTVALERIERERALIRSRAGSQRVPSIDSAQLNSPATH
ncbi:MAG: hypothetical protein ACT4OZ_13210 [Gemmatimonadota bacterium]